MTDRDDETDDKQSPPTEPLLGVTATPFKWQQPSTIKRRAFLYGKHATRKFVSITAAPGATGKSSLAITEVLAFVSGRDLLDDDLRGVGGRAWYLGLEDPPDEYQRRFTAAMLHYSIPADEVDGRLFVDSGRRQNFVIACESSGGVKIITPRVDAIIRNIEDNGIDLVVVDPFLNCHTLPESANTAINEVVKVWAEIAEKTNCAVELVFHTRKGNGCADDLTADDVRGASAAVNAARSVRVLVPMTKTEAANAKVADHRDFFWVVNPKANMTKEPEKWRQIVGVPLGNEGPREDDFGFYDPDDPNDRPVIEPEDVIGVATAWEWPTDVGAVPDEQLDAIKRRIAVGDHRRDTQAENWAGVVIAETMNIDLTNVEGKEQVKRLLAAWIASGDFKVVTKPDAKRRPRQFITVDD